MAEYDPESYWSRVAQEIGKRGRENFLAGDDNPYLRMKRKKFLGRFLDAIDFGSKIVLEVGCGPGGNLLHIAQRSSPNRLIGVDISEAMIALSRTNLARHDIPVELHKIDGMRLPFSDKSIDVCFTVTVLQHNTAEEVFRNLVREMCRVTKSAVVAMEDTGSEGAGGTGDYIDRRREVYESVFADDGFVLDDCQYLKMRCSRFLYFRILPMFRRKNHQEGQPETPVFRTLLMLLLPASRIVDEIIEDKAELTKMVFRRKA